MTISSLTGLSYGAQINAQRLAALKSQFDGLSTQLSTGKTAQTYGGLGAGRSTALSAQARIATLDGYAQGITGARTKLNLASASVSQVQKIASGIAGTLGAGTAGQTYTGLATQRLNARQQLASALDALNQTAGQDYLFSGRASDTAPAASAALILDGDKAAGLDGLTGMIAERKTADGVGGTGNLSASVTASTVTLSESAVGLTRANFGFILGSATSASGALTVATTPAAAPTTSVTLTKQPKDGDVVRVTLNQADGSQKLVDYVARTNPTPGSTTEFAIGADAAATTNKLKTLIGAGAVAAAQSGDPPAADVTVASEGTAGSVEIAVGTPADGDAVTFNLKLRDGTTTSVTLTARTTADAGDPTQFAIGATSDDTAANLKAALEKTLGSVADTTLASSSAALAAKDMFAGSTSAGLSPRRVVPTYAADGVTKTGFRFAANPAGKTVTWYKGDDGPGSARGTASVQVGDDYDVAYGARANEAAFQSALAGLGALASESFPSAGSDTVSGADAVRYNALSSRVVRLLAPNDGSQTIAQVGTELGLADASIANAQTRNTATKAVLQNTVSGIEDASTETVAAQLVSLQTQLQASYQVTSMLSKLSLVNYL